MQLGVKIYRISHFFYRNKLRRISKLMDGINYLVTNSFVPGSCQIGANVKFGYGGIGMVVHSRAKIGDNCFIGQGITIGGRSKKEIVPIIGNEVYLGAGCRVLGPVEIGDNVIIGPNAVVLQSIPSGCIAVGIPAKIIKRGIKIGDFI